MQNISNLQKLILLSLKKASATGYDISKQIQASNVLDAKHQTVYRDLRNLESKGLISHVKKTQSTKPDKKICSLTFKGNQAIDAFSTTTDINEISYKGEYTLMLAALNSSYFKELAERLAIKIFSLESSQPEITDDIEFTLQHRTTCLLRTELDFTKAALLTIKYEKKRLGM